MNDNAFTLVAIRPATPSDASAISAIYAPYVERTAISFEYDAPDEKEMSGRIEATLPNYPWLVAEQDGIVVGYAYLSPFKERPAYRWAAETSIYVEWNHRQSGVGRLLYSALEQEAKSHGILNLNACIAFREDMDEHLPSGSIPFHQRVGYTKAAHFHQCGFKFGRWYDIIWMEKIIGPHK